MLLRLTKEAHVIKVDTGLRAGVLWDGNAFPHCFHVFVCFVTKVYTLLKY